MTFCHKGYHCPSRVWCAMSVTDSIASCGLQALAPSDRKMLFVIEGERQSTVSEHCPEIQGNFRHSVEDFHNSLV